MVLCFDQISNISNSHHILTITQIPIDLEAMEDDSAKVAMAGAWHEKLSRDIYLFEATEVLKDMYFSNTGVLPEDK